MKKRNQHSDPPAAFTPLAIIGIGCHFPQAENSNDYWSNISEGIDAITEIPSTHWQVADYFDQDQKSPDRTYGKRGGFLSPIDFNPMEFNIPPNVLEAIDTSQLLGLVTAGQALKDAGYGPDKDYDRNRTSVILGVTGTLELVIPLGARLGHPIWRKALKDAGVDDSVANDVVERISDSYVPWQENSFPGLLGNVVAGRISKQYDLGGTNCVVDAACASSFSALHLAGMELATGKSDMVVTGGIDTFNDIFMYMCFSKTPALSPTGDAKPFDAAGDGTILGEGLGIVVIKRLADAERDGDRIYSVIRGIGSSSDGKGDAIYAPSASGQKKALLDAYDRAGVTPDSIGLVEAHGTGTKVGDAVEVSALRDVYGQSDTPWCSLGSVKSQIGHTKASAGSAGLIKAALALHNKVIPPTIKVKKPLDEVTSGRTPFYLTTEKRPWLPRNNTPRRAGVSAFGFGGSNFHLVLEEYTPTRDSAVWDGNVQILAFSGANAGELETALNAVPADGSWNELRAAAMASRASFNTKAPCRLALVVEKNHTRIAALVANAGTMLRTNSQTPWSTPDGAFFATGEKSGRLGMLFPGQGAQYTGMLRDLACRFPEMLETLTAADNGFSSPDHRTLSDLIYPPTAFTPQDKELQEAALRATQAAQPAIGAVSLGLMKLLKSFGIEPDATAGHSYGELTALCTAGRLDETVFHELSRLRGALMGEGGGDKGSMLAVPAPLSVIEEIIIAEKLDLVIANRNAPAQAVLSGSTSEIERAVTVFSARKIACKRLPVAAAFHSTLVADAAKPFKTALDKIKLHKARIPVYANTNAQEYPANAAAARTLLAEQLARPVEFVAQIEAMYAAGVRTFIEAGPGARLTGLVSAILGEREHVAHSIDASSGKRSGLADLARALARIAVGGHDANLALWDADYLPPAANAKKPLMTVPICGANYVKPRPKRPPVTPATRPATAVVPAQGVAAQAQNHTSSNSPIGRAVLTESLRVTREGMAVLQKMQEETAQLHRRFLEGQETSAKTIQTLLAQQQHLLQEGSAVSGQVAFTRAAPAVMVPEATVQKPQPISMPAPLAVKPDHKQNRITETLLGVVSEKTGYPIEMLELDMGMDSDLGIDSIKRVEILSALQDHLPGAPVIGPEHMGSLRTLAEIAAHLGAGTEPQAVASGAVATVATSLAADKITETLLAVVSEKTGYPTEMLELDMGMDSDLGIDSIKRVEILSALQDRLPGAPVIGPEHMGSLRTLAEIAAHLGAGNEPHAISSGAVTPVATLPTADRITETLLAVVSEKTGYPTEMLELDMGMDSDLGIDSIKRVEILSALQDRLPGAPVIGPEHMGSLRTLAEIAAHLGAGIVIKQDSPCCNEEPCAVQTTSPPAITPSLTAAIVKRSSICSVSLDHPSGSITLAQGGECWISDDGSGFSEQLGTMLRNSGHNVRLVSADQPEIVATSVEISALVIIAPLAGTDDQFLENSFILLKHAAPALRRAAAAGGALFATVSRLDGSFGCDSKTFLTDPLSGGLAGLVKTAAREWTDVTCKAIDLGSFPDSTSPARAVADELFRSGPVEVGLTANGRIGLILADLPALPTPKTAPVLAGEVVVVTGGGRGVTTAAAVALARAYQPLLVLLGRSPELLPEPHWLAGLIEESVVKRAILEHSGEKLHPREIEERYRAVTAGRELRTTLANVEAAGGRAIYRSVDIRDNAAVSTLLKQIRSEYGPIRGIVHGAGVLADRLIIDKTREQFAMVYATKVHGLRALLAATAGDDLRFIALFASTTGRFGRTGQVDYAVANEVLNKLAQDVARRRPACRTVSINWGPWDGGMVTPALKKVFAGEGIGLISLAEGGDLLIREIAATSAPVEVVALAENIEKSAAVTAPASTTPLAEAFNLTLRVDDYPFLRSHVMDGKAVLPMAMIVEWLAHGALHGNPGLRCHGFNDLRICKGVVFERNTPYTVRIMAGRAEKRDSLYIVTTELIGTGRDGRALLHARAEIVLARKLPEGIRSISDLPDSPYTPLNGRIYDPARLFHGSDLQGIEHVECCSDKGIAALVKRAPQPTEWIRQPFRGAWITDPLVIDSAFQMMILWSFERFGSGSLPCFAGRYRQYSEIFPTDGAQVIIRVTAEREHGATADMEFLDRNSGKLVARLEDYECVIDPSLGRAFQLNQLPKLVSGALRAA
ncbi:MAG TPA: SDR family NAD(P)-dependent oxidoreductase [Desulfuromonadaceae bacterium]